ncbi:hypothetical protein PPYR_11899 [Photinus pyralis]|uniref:DUF4218 domain-containing protein n=1 Tax=Photinus pyralis TaxID=7054 RepID=A0A1Y1MR04_PHOPY|nr:uncharacterized protein LOC116163552 isoform X1 [Photinus pyralis]XP_031333402.1 uncharacterized protein LOC116163552 isoform X1 [Photinus pyralis]XP_031333403.1 uncharacterized protein LOC116163552 isoform X1 [Photinus pyralis]XP_031333404.1 uncharacterized protein LOC116163552 isoform X1 [Photinus pyralis]XP_031333405.1 uncharacterized protein LOC116163552 isoform X1 [Photinus pyralis]XP_031333406.1 uncharacterized protein LOC116163552 isoform X1 [Photinus pyralis]XP_031333407.1 uncharac
MHKRIRRKLKPIVGKRQFLRRVAQSVQQTLNNTSSSTPLPSTSSVPENPNSILREINSPILHPFLHEEFVANNNENPNANDSQTNYPFLLPSQDILEPSLLVSLMHWCVTFNIPHIAITSLLHILHRFHPELPLSSKTLLGTPRQVNTTKVGDGQFYYFGLKTGLSFVLSTISEIKDKIEISFNIDGIPLFKSSNQQFWPILALVKNFKSKPFVVGIFSGTSKPKPLELFLNDFIEELNLIIHNGFEYNSKVYNISVHSFLCDAPARAFIKHIKSHSGYSSCEKCTNPGKYKDGRIIFETDSFSKRTDSSFLLQQDEDHHTGISPLLKLGIGLVSVFPIDYMHACCLGVMRKLLCFWLNGALTTRLPNQKVNAISNMLISWKQHIPSDFNRKPRSLSEVQRWKATEFRTFLLYLGAVVLNSNTHKAVYEHFLLFHVAILILSSKHLISKFGCSYANELLNTFVKHCEKLYGSQFLIYNIHILLHLSDDVIKYGPLDQFSCFPFENFLGQIKRLIRSPTNTLQQACCRIQEIQNIRFNVNQMHPPANMLFPHDSGPVPPQIAADNCKQFLKCFHKGFEICVHSYSKANSYCITNKGKVLQIQNIILMQDNILIVGKFFQTYNSIYTYPLNSKDLNIYLLSDLSHNIEISSLDEVMGKCLVLPAKNNNWASFPLIHTFDEIKA